MRNSLWHYFSSFFSRVNSYNISYLDNFLHECTTNLPINNSMVAYVIIVKCLNYHLNEKELNLKTLYLEMTCSEIATRDQILKLINGGWVRLEKSKNDKRVKFLKPTEKLIFLSDKIMNNTASIAISSLLKFARK